MNNRNHGKVKTSICLLMALIMCVALVGLFMSLEAELGIYKQGNVITAVNQSDYQQRAYNDFQDKYKSLLKYNDFPESAAGDAFNKTFFNLHFSESLKNSLKGKGYRVLTSKEETKLEKSLTTYLTKHNVQLNGNIDDAVERLVSDVSGYFRNNAQFQFGDYYYHNKNNVGKTTGITIPVTIGIITVMAAMLWLVNERKHRALRYMAFAIGGALIPEVVIYCRLMLDRGLRPEGSSDYYSDFIDSLFASLTPPFIFGIIITGGIFAGLVFLIRRKRNEIH